MSEQEMLFQKATVRNSAGVVYKSFTVSTKLTPSSCSVLRIGTYHSGDIGEITPRSVVFPSRMSCEFATTTQSRHAADPSIAERK